MKILGTDSKRVVSTMSNGSSNTTNGSIAVSNSGARHQEILGEQEQRKADIINITEIKITGAHEATAARSSSSSSSSSNSYGACQNIVQNLTYD